MLPQRRPARKFSLASGAAEGKGKVILMGFKMTGHVEFVQGFKSTVGKWAEEDVGMVWVLLGFQNDFGCFWIVGECQRKWRHGRE